MKCIKCNVKVLIQKLKHPFEHTVICQHQTNIAQIHIKPYRKVFFKVVYSSLILEVTSLIRVICWDTNVQCYELCIRMHKQIYSLGNPRKIDIFR